MQLQSFVSDLARRLSATGGSVFEIEVARGGARFRVRAVGSGDVAAALHDGVGEYNCAVVERDGTRVLEFETPARPGA
jgi:hypothetical protein